MSALLAINNFFESGTVTESSEAAGYPSENAYDNLLSDYWQPGVTSPQIHTIDVDMGSAMSADLFGFYSSDLYSYSGAAVKLYYSNNGSTYTLVDTISPTTAGPKLKSVTSNSYRYWRLQIETTSPQQPKMQHVFIGAQIAVQRGLGAGFAPPALGSENVPITSESANGIFLGRSTKKAAIKSTLEFKNVTAAWMRTNWPTILAAIEAKPFMLLPSPTSYPDEASFSWTDGPIKTPQYNGSNYMDFSIPIKSIIT
jgi:hypothetical protein